MGTKSTEMYLEVSSAMDALKDNAKKCDEAIDYLKDELSAFSNEPLLSPKKKHIYDHMKGVASVSMWTDVRKSGPCSEG